MKKLLFIILLVIIKPMTMLADYKVAIDGIKYNLVSKSKEAIVINFDNGYYSGDVVIPSTVNYYGNTYNVVYIGQKAFQNCTNLTSVNIPNSVKRIEAYSFQGCIKLNTINIPNSVNYVGSWAFSGCTELTSIHLSTKMAQITEGLFQNCVKLSSITIPSSVTIINDEAFSGCTALSSINIPKSVQNIGEKTFNNCPNITTITVASDNTIYDSRNSCNAIISTSSNTLIVGCKKTSIPNNVTEIGNYAFQGCTGLTSISIPNSVTSIGPAAFYNCTGLKKIKIPNKVEKIYENAFCGCSNLKIVDIGTGVTGIGAYAFQLCDELLYVICRATSVPQTNNTAFSGSHIENATLIVPDNSLNQYKTTTPWDGFGHIRKLSAGSIVVIANNYTRKYGDENPSFGYLSNSSLSGTPQISCSATTSSPTGTYSITISKGSVTNTGVIYVGGTLTVTKTPLTITPHSYTINVGDDLPTFDATYTGLINNETEEVLSPVFSCTAIDSNTPGLYEITVSAISDNYDIIVEKGSLIIQPTIATITISDVGVATYCFDFGLDFNDITDFKAYIATGYNRQTGNVIVQPIKEAPGGTGLYIKGKPGTYQLPIYDSDSYYVNMLVGVTTPTTIQSTDGDYTNFVLYATNSSDACFRPLTDSYNLKANRAYLQIPTSEVACSAGANSVGIEFEEEATGIEEILPEKDMLNLNWYSINGQKLNGKPNQKGIYVVNGHKVVIK